MFRRNYGSVFDGDERWQGIHVPAGKIYAWSAKSTYVKNPPYFEGMTLQPPPVRGDRAARACWRCWAIRSRPTTSRPPATSAQQSPAARYLMEQGVQPVGFQSVRGATRQP